MGTNPGQIGPGSGADTGYGEASLTGGLAVCAAKASFDDEVRSNYGTTKANLE
jgi:hypothetical protein